MNCCLATVHTRQIEVCLSLLPFAVGVSLILIIYRAFRLRGSYRTGRKKKTRPGRPSALPAASVYFFGVPALFS
jgi:hypothetical protein